MMSMSWPEACTFSPIGVPENVHSTQGRPPRTSAPSASPLDPRRAACWPVLGDLGSSRQGRPRGGQAGAPARPTARHRETLVGHYIGRRRSAGSGGVALAVLGSGLVEYAPHVTEAAAQLNEQPDRLLTHGQGAGHRIWRSTAPYQLNTMSPSSGWRGGLDRKPSLPWAISCATSGISLTRGRRQARGVHVCAGWNGSHGC